MAGESKKLQFGVNLNESDVRNVVRMAGEMQRAFERMGEAAKRALTAMGAIGQGGGVGQVTNQAFRPGQGGIKHGNTPGARGQAGGIVGAVFGSDSQGVRQLATTTQQAFQSAGTGIRTFVQSAESDLKRLQRTVDGLKSSMGGLGSNTGGMGGMGGFDYGYGSRDAGGVFGRGGGGRQLPPPGNWDFLSGSRSAAPGVGPGGRNNNFSPFWNGGQVYSGGGAGGGTPRGPAAGGGGGSMFGGLGMLAGAAGLGFLGAGSVLGVGIGAYQFGAHAYDQQRQASLSYQVNEPLQRLQRQAAVAAPFVQQYQQARAGNLSYVAARNEQLRSASQTALMDPATRLELSRRLAGVEGSDLNTMLKKPIQNFTGKMLASKAPMNIPSGEAWDANGAAPIDFDALNKVPGAMDILEEITKRKMSQEQAGDFQAAIQARVAMQNPRWKALAESLTGNAMGNVSLRRAGFYGTPKGRDPMEYMMERRANLMAQGYSPEEEAGARRSIVSGAGMGYLGQLGGTSLLSMQAGGLGNAVDLMRAGGILGGSAGAGGRFLRNTVQGSIGRGGLDVTAGSALFADLAGRAQSSGQFGAGGTFATYAASAAGLVGAGGADVAQQQRRSMLLGEGNEQMTQFMNGAKAPLYQMTSMLGSISSAGGYGGASEALAKMRPEVMQSIAAGGEIPRWAAAQGVTKEMAQRNLKYQERAPLMEVVDKLQGGEAGKLLEQYRATESRTGGGFRTFAEEQTAGMSGGAKRRKQEELAQILGGMVPGATPEQGEGALMSQLVGDAPKLRGRGAGAAAPQGLEKDALGAQSAQLAADFKLLRDNVAGFGLLIKQLMPETVAGEAGVNAAGTANLDREGAGTEAAGFANALKIAAAAADRYAKASEKKKDWVRSK